MKVNIIGVGMGSAGSMTGQAEAALAGSDIVFGAARMLECAGEAIDRLAASGGAAPAAPALEDALRDGDRHVEEPRGFARRVFVESISPSKIVERLGEGGGVSVASVLCSGDTGFFSLATSLSAKLAEMDPAPEVEIFPGITTVQYLASRLRRPWQGCRLASAHGRGCDVLAEVLSNEEVFLLTGGDQTPRTIIGDLVAAGLGDVEVAVGERLSYEDEAVSCGTAAELAGRDFDTLSAMWISHGPLCDDEVASARGFSGIPDGLFIRGKAPMTKSEVRAVSTSKIRPADGEVIYDIGAGTGSVSVELACMNPRCRVFAVEFKDEAFDLLLENRKRFGAFNITAVKGRAPEATVGLPAPDAVFVGGSTGELENIARAALDANPKARLVVTAVSMETVAQATGVLESLAEEGLTAGYSATQVGVTRTREAGRYHLLAPESPVFIFEAVGTGE